LSSWKQRQQQRQPENERKYAHPHHNRNRRDLKEASNERDAGIERKKLQANHCCDTDAQVKDMSTLLKFGVVLSGFQDMNDEDEVSTEQLCEAFEGQGFTAIQSQHIARNIIMRSIAQTQTKKDAIKQAHTEEDSNCRSFFKVQDKSVTCVRLLMQSWLHFALRRRWEREQATRIVSRRIGLHLMIFFLAWSSMSFHRIRQRRTRDIVSAVHSRQSRARIFRSWHYEVTRKQLSAMSRKLWALESISF